MYALEFLVQSSDRGFPACGEGGEEKNLSTGVQNHNFTRRLSHQRAKQRPRDNRRRRCTTASFVPMCGERLQGR
jgi:hypothetical protein